MTTTLAERTRRTSAPARGLAVAVGLVALTMIVPAVTGWNVHVNHFPPLHADWDPRVGWGTVPAVLIAGLVSLRAVDLAETLPWRRLLVWTFAAGLAWMLALAFVDGAYGVGHILTTSYEYLRTAHRYRDVGALHHLLQNYVRRIPFSAEPHNLPVHIAGHPAGALLFFWVLVRLGLGGGFAAGLVVTLVAATTALAVLVTVRTLGAEHLARRAAPFLAFGTAAIWQSVSADAMFAAVSAWGMACLALAATRRSASWSVLAGLLLGYAMMLSYGLPLLGVLAIAVLVAAGSFFPLVVTAATALAVMVAFGVAGFNYLEALPAIQSRYWEGTAGRRPFTYWTFGGDFAAFALSTGPLAYAGAAQLWSRRHDYLADASTRVLALLGGAGVAMVVLADLSQMSHAEVERIWLPFVPWVQLSCALLPETWRRRGLVLQVGSALVLQHLLATGW